MELHQLTYFVAVADHAGFSRAAAHCRITQPSLSQQIKKLETTLGHKLFDRLGRTVELTEAGRALLPRARRILAEVRDVSTSLNNDIASGTTQQLAIGAIPTIAPYLLPPHLAAFRRRFPDCDLTVREDLTDRLVEAVIASELDLAITSAPIDHPLADVQIIGEEHLLVALPADSPIPDTISITDLRAEPTVVLHDVHCLGQQIHSFCTTRRIQSRITCRGSQLSTVLNLVALGMGYSLIPEMCARTHPAHSSRATPAPVRFTRIARTPPTRQIAIVRRKDRSRSLVSTHLADTIAAALARGAHAFTP